MIKLPEPKGQRLAYRCVAGYGEDEYEDFYTESQMRQAIKDALEEAAQKCLGLGHWVHPEGCAEAIRKLKEDV